jgi:hypothetical protein
MLPQNAPYAGPDEPTIMDERESIFSAEFAAHAAYWKVVATSDAQVSGTTTVRS